MLEDIRWILSKTIRIVEDEKKRDKLNIKDAATVKQIIGDSAKIKDIL